MRARIGTVEVEGTADEIAALIRSLGNETPSPTASVAQGTGRVSLRKYVAEDVALRVLNRRPLSQEQRVLLTTIKQNLPGWTTANELQKIIGYSSAQLAGLLGAFGKRVTGTEGYRQGTWFFDQEWNHDRACNQYRLPDSVVSAMTRLGL